MRIEPLARALGVTKGGFYWHFDDRRALLGEMLDAWERASVDEVIERVEGGGGDARARLRRLFALASQSDELLRIDLAVRDWSRRERSVADRLRRVDDRRMDYMRSLFGAFCPDGDDVEARCMLAFSLWIGGHGAAPGVAIPDRRAPPAAAPMGARSATRRWWCRGLSIAGTETPAKGLQQGEG